MATYSGATVLTVQEISRSGKSVTEQMTAATATDGEKFLNDGKTFLRVKNGSVNPITVTVDNPSSIDGQALADLTITVAATGDGDGLDFQDIGPFTAMYNQSDGYVWAYFSAVTTVTVGAYRLANP
jgi:hypothetical protein